MRDRIGKGHNVEIAPLSGILAKLKAQRQAVIARWVLHCRAACCRCFAWRSYGPRQAGDGATSSCMFPCATVCVGDAVPQFICRTKPAPVRRRAPTPPLEPADDAADEGEDEDILLLSDEEEQPAAPVAASGPGSGAGTQPASSDPAAAGDGLAHTQESQVRKACDNIAFSLLAVWTLCPRMGCAAPCLNRQEALRSDACMGRRACMSCCVKHAGHCMVDQFAAPL